MPLPLDNGFLRRECPTCEREFKWFSSPEGEGTPPQEGGYFCPYCAIQAPLEAWWTKPQLDYLQNVVAREAVAPELQRFKRELERIGRTPGSLIEVSAEVATPDAMNPLTEPEDMRRVEFVCHPEEPLKVLETWTRAVHCLICGTSDS